MENLLKDMGKRIFDRRKQLNMTQETLAELAHVTPQTISTAELGQKAMRPETILKVCDALHISTEYLLRGVITEADSSLLMKKISTLTPKQYRHFEDILDSFIAPYRKRHRSITGSHASFDYPLLRNADKVLAIRLRVLSSISGSSSTSCAVESITGAAGFSTNLAVGICSFAFSCPIPSCRKISLQ